MKHHRIFVHVNWIEIYKINCSSFHSTILAVRNTFLFEERRQDAPIIEYIKSTQRVNKMYRHAEVTG